MGNDREIKPVMIEPISFWVKWGKPYLLSLGWLFIVIVFAYLQIIVEYFSADEKISFFTAYSATQRSLWAIVANLGFMAFAWIDYIATHKRTPPQWFVIIFALISAVFMIPLPVIVNYLVENGQSILIRGEFVNVTWVCYILHSIHLVALYILRAETRKVQIINEYTKSIGEKSPI